MDFEIDDLAGVFLLAQPFAESGERHRVVAEVLAPHPAAAMLAHKLAGMKEVPELGGQPG